uniref:Conserved oligomeric Golgi complex subunit 5 n=1 Tax=Spongospora subterranea TaxID=70186 RepID=A0A0H5R0Y2_9EUKA|eukprot:CRZ01449.1 hypothetical protein [Spongospora subterranea]
MIDRAEGSASDSSEDELGLAGPTLDKRQTSGLEYTSHDELVKAWSDDDALRVFLDDDFDSDQFLTGLQLHGISKLQDKLNAALATLDHYIQHKVSDHHEDLLRQSTQISAVEHDANALLADAAALQSSYNAVYDAIMDPFTKMKELIKETQHAQECAELLRNVLRFVQLINKSKAISSSDKEPARYALVLSEISEVAESNGLIHVNSLRSNLNWVQQETANVKLQAEASLKAAIVTSTHVDIGAALQVAFNLGTLPAVVAAVIQDLLSDFSDEVSQLFDLNKILSPLPADMKKNFQDPAERGQQIRAAVWRRIETVLNSLLECVSRMHALHSVLQKKTDPIVRKSFMELVQGGISFMEDTAQDVYKIFRKSLDNFSALSKLVSEALTSEYPRLFDLCESCWQRGLGRVLPPESRLHLFDTIQTFQNEFISSQLERIQGPVALMFPGHLSPAVAPVPTITDMSTMFSNVLDTLSSLESRTELQRPMLKGLNGTVCVCVSKCEALAGNLTSMSPLLWDVNTFDRLNSIFTIAGFLDQILTAIAQSRHTRCQSIPASLAAPILLPGRRAVHALKRQIIAPIFTLTLNTLEASLDKSDISSVIQAELNRNTSFLKRIVSKPPLARFFLKEFVSQLETMVIYRCAAVLSSGFARPSIIEKVLEDITSAGSVIASYSKLTDSVAPRTQQQQQPLNKFVQFTSWLSGPHWRPCTESEFTCIPKFVIVSVSISRSKGLISVCDLLCLDTMGLFHWMLAHNEENALRLCENKVIPFLSPGDETDQTIIDYISHLINNQQQ